MSEEARARLADEQERLNAGILAIVQFIASAEFHYIDYVDQRLLREQRAAMIAYSDALNARISRGRVVF